MMDISFFNTPFATVTKAYRGDSGERYVEGIASSTGLDQTKERMSPQAIKLMAAKFTGKPLNSEHQNSWDDELGKIVQAKVIEREGKPALWIKAKLHDWLTRSKDLFDGLETGKLQNIGFSVEGKINQGGLVKEFDETLGQYIPVYRDIEPAAVAVTNKPANLDTFCNAVSKSIKVEDLPEDKKESYVVIKTIVDGTSDEETVCKHDLCEHQKCMDKACKNVCDKCIAMNKDLTIDTPDVTAPSNATALGCSHAPCPHGSCLNKECKNMCKACMTAKMDMAAAGSVPNTLLARQDIHGKGEEETNTEKATTPDATNVQVASEPIGETTDADLNNPPEREACTHDYCEHGNCLEEGCSNECSVCGDKQEEILNGENKLVDKANNIINAHETKPSKYEDVPGERFLDPENHKYPADAKHLPAALAYFNHSGQRSAGGYSPEKWGTMGRKLAGFLGGGYHYDNASEKVVNDEDNKADKSIVEGGELNKEYMKNNGVLQKKPYSPEVLDIIKAWGGNNPGNQDILVKAGASAVSADAQATPMGQVQPQQTVQKGSSSSDGSSSSSTPSTSSGHSSSSDSGSSSSDSDHSSSGSSSSGDSSSGHSSSSDGDSFSSLLSSVLTTLSDMKSSVSGNSIDSSSDGSSDSSTSTSDKTSTDKNFGGSDMSTKTSTDKNFPPQGAASDGNSADSSDSYDEATKALATALQNFQKELEKAKKQPPTGNFAENGTQHAGAAKEGNDAVNGKAPEPDYRDEQKRKHPMPKPDAPEGQEPDFNSLAESKTASVGKSIADQEKFIKSIDTMVALMTKIGEKVESVEGKVDAMPSVRKGVAIDKQFTEEEKAGYAKVEADKRNLEAKLLADPKVSYKEVHQFRTYGVLPAGYQA